MSAEHEIQPLTRVAAVAEKSADGQKNVIRDILLFRYPWCAPLRDLTRGTVADA